MVFFADGISESFNAAYEERGDEPLMHVIGASLALSARALIDRILRASDELVGAAASTTR